MKVILCFALVFLLFNSNSIYSQSLLIDRDVLSVNYKVLKSQPSDVLVEIIRQAEEFMNIENLNVVGKSILPESNQKHDYFSLATYWWPDPTKVDGKPYIPKEGKPNPDRLKILDFKNMQKLCSAVRTLAVAYFFTKDEKYASKVEKLVYCWFVNKETKMNPNLNYTQSIPGKVSGRPEGLIDTKSFVEMLDALSLLESSSSLKNSTMNSLKEWFDDYIEWLYTSEIGKQGPYLKNNIATAYYMQILAYSKFVGDKEKARVKKLIEEEIKPLLSKQFDNEGKQPLELKRSNSWSYSISNLVYWFNIALLSESYGVDLWNYSSTNNRSLKKGFSYLENNAYKKWRFRQEREASLETTLNALRVTAWKKINGSKRILAHNIGNITKTNEVKRLRLDPIASITLDIL